MTVRSATTVAATASNSVAPYGESVNETAAGVLRTSELFDRANLLQSDVATLHHREWATEYDRLTREKALRGVRSLLTELSVDRGLSWADIARCAGVSVAAVRKWRLGDGATPEKRGTLARLAGFLDLLLRYFPVEDPAQWLEMELAPPAPLTALNLYQGGRWDLVIKYAQGQAAEAILDDFEPDWRRRCDDGLELVEASDGQLSLVQAYDDAVE